MYMHSMSDNPHNGNTRSIFNSDSARVVSLGIKNDWNMTTTIFKGTEAKPAKALFLVIVSDKA